MQWLLIGNSKKIENYQLNLKTNLQRF